MSRELAINAIAKTIFIWKGGQEAGFAKLTPEALSWLKREAEIILDLPEVTNHFHTIYKSKRRAYK